MGHQALKAQQGDVPTPGRTRKTCSYAAVRARSCPMRGWSGWLNGGVEVSESESSPDRFQLTVDDEIFEVARDLSQPGAYHYTWLTGRNPGYGFGGLEPAGVTTADHVASIRNFLAMVDPTTGYIEDDSPDK
jgi:hypothetical protein